MRQMAPLFLTIYSIIIISVYSQKNRDTIRWIAANNGDIPSNALQVGHYQGKKLYFARSNIFQGIHIGYIAENQNRARIPWGGEVHSLENYEVLVGNMQNVKWVEAQFGSQPQDAVESGREKNGQALYLGRGEINSDLIPGKFRKEFGGLNIPYESKEMTLSVYQLLTFSEEEYSYQNLFYQQEFQKYKLSLAQKLLHQRDDYKEDYIAFKSIAIVEFIVIVILIALIIGCFCCSKRKRNFVENGRTDSGAPAQSQRKIQDQQFKVVADDSVDKKK